MMLRCEQSKKESKLDHLSSQNNPQTLTNLLRCSKILQNYKGGCFDLPNLPELRNFSKFSQISEIPLIFWQICADFRFWLFLMYHIYTVVYTVQLEPYHVLEHPNPP